MRGTEITDIRIFYNHPEYNHKHPIIYKDYLDLGGSKNTQSPLLLNSFVQSRRQTTSYVMHKMKAESTKATQNIRPGLL